VENAMTELPKILHVEDDLDIQAIALLSLETLGGFTIVQASSGQEALEKAPAFSPDLLLLDVMMPTMDGPELLQELRKLPQFSQTPVIFMTAKAQPEEVQQFVELGAIDVITKPFDPLTLADQIRAIWQNTR
jgi:two-component system OmpR family response regulator